MEATPMKCPFCDGVGEKYWHVGRLGSIVPFSKEHWDWASSSAKGYGKLLRLAEFGVYVECPRCEGSGVVYTVPARLIVQK